MKSIILYFAAVLLPGMAASVVAAGVQPPARPAVATAIVPGEAKHEREHTIHGHHSGKVKQTAAAETQAVMGGRIDIAKAEQRENAK